ncbi:MAG: type IV toxin-antitoxin system AbiEi family antitoxin domain-containing protein [Burkholderiales bacterium]
MTTPLTKARAVMRRRSAVRSKELTAAGIARMHLSRLTAAGKLVRVARGLYALPNRKPGTQEGLAVVTQRMPHALFCLLTALRLHELTTVAPFEVWIAIGNKERAPKSEWPPMRIVRYSGAALKSGIETRTVAGARIRVTTVAKTVADCFKFRRTVGIDVARDALREALRGKRATVDDLWKFAKVCRVTKVMRPYLDAFA